LHPLGRGRRVCPDQIIGRLPGRVAPGRAGL